MDGGNAGEGGFGGGSGGGGGGTSGSGATGGSDDPIICADTTLCTSDTGCPLEAPIEDDPCDDTRMTCYYCDRTTQFVQWFCEPPSYNRDQAWRNLGEKICQ
jgi:hypothetical protein